MYEHILQEFELHIRIFTYVHTNSNCLNMPLLKLLLGIWTSDGNIFVSFPSASIWSRSMFRSFHDLWFYVIPEHEILFRYKSDDRRLVKSWASIAYMERSCIKLVTMPIWFKAVSQTEHRNHICRCSRIIFSDLNHWGSSLTLGLH